MDRYLVDKFKGKYRVKAHYDLTTNEYIRDSEGNLDDSFGDFYIDCQNGIEISHWGGKVLKCYIPSLGRGRNIVRKLEEMGKQDVVTKYTESDDEVVFHFHVGEIELIADLCKVKTSGSSISPFSVKNLPNLKPNWNKYEPQDKEKYDHLLELLKNWISKSGLGLGKAYNKFYIDFGEHINFDIVDESKEKIYKPLHIIDINNFTDAAIEWLSANTYP